jgi:pimeloyl-ACP methyl ester carboxylesterase
MASAETLMLIKVLLAISLVTGALTMQSPDIGAPPGRLIEVSGRKLHFNCAGAGSPTVLLEAGASSFALDWSLVQPAIAKTNRVCSYDRAGHGWSDARGSVDTPERIVTDLHAALAAAGEKGPFLMVGASLGAIYVRLYQLDHPDDVVGLVLVDPATEDRAFTYYQGSAVTIGALTADQLKTTLPASGSFPNRTRSVQTGAPFDLMPTELYQLRLKLDQRLISSAPAAVSAEVIHESSEGSRAAFARLLESRTKPDAPIRKRPVIVLTRSQDATAAVAENHAGVARLSTNSRHTVVPKSGHEIHLFAPAAVIQAIEDVSTASRDNSPLPPR